MYFDKEISAYPIIDLNQLEYSKGKVLKQITGSLLSKFDKSYFGKTIKCLK